MLDTVVALLRVLGAVVQRLYWLHHGCTAESTSCRGCTVQIAVVVQVAVLVLVVLVAVVVLETMVAFKRLAGLISEKHDQPYSSTLSFIRCKIAFSLIDSAIACPEVPDLPSMLQPGTST